MQVVQQLLSVTSVCEQLQPKSADQTEYGIIEWSKVTGPQVRYSSLINCILNTCQRLDQVLEKMGFVSQRQMVQL